MKSVCPMEPWKMDDDNENDDNSCNDENDNDSFFNFIITTIIIIFVSAIVSIIIIIISISIITNTVTTPYISCYKLDDNITMEHKCGNHFKFRFNGYDNLMMPSVRNE